MKKTVLAAVVAAAVSVAALTATGCGSPNVVVSSDGSVPGVTVTASSEVKVTPDRASIDVAVTTTGETASAVQSANAERVDAVTKALTGLGIAEKSIQTTNTYLSPRYDYSENAVFDDGDPESGIAGYEMTTTLSISDLEIAQVGTVLEACTAQGANSASGIRFYSSEYDKKYAEALDQAVAKAHAKAEVLAGAAGSRIGSILNLTEGYQNMAYSYSNGAMAEAAYDTAGAMKVMPGEVSVEAQVTVTYAIE